MDPGNTYFVKSSNNESPYNFFFNEYYNQPLFLCVVTLLTNSIVKGQLHLELYPYRFSITLFYKRLQWNRVP